MRSNYEKHLTLQESIKMMLMSLGVKEELIKSTYSFNEDFNLDTLAQNHLLDLVESYFHIKIEDDIIGGIRTPEDLYQVVERKLSVNSTSELVS